MTTLKEKIAVMQAYADGMPIEFSSNGETWHPMSDPIWNWGVHDYRVAKKKIKGMIAICKRPDTLASLTGEALAEHSTTNFKVGATLENFKLPSDRFVFKEIEIEI